MAKEMRYGLVIWVSGNAARALKSIGRSVRNVGKAAKGLAFGRRGILGSIGLGGLVTGGLFAPILGAAKLVVGGVVSLVKGAVRIATGIITAFVRLATSLLRGVLRTLRKVTLVAGAAFIGLTAFAVRTAAKVGDAWSKVRTIINLGPLVQKIKMELRDLAIATGRDLTEVMEGYYQVISAGFTKASDALEFLKVTLAGSIAGWTDFPTVVKAVSRTMKNFGIDVRDTRKVMDALLKTVDVGQIELPELANVIGGIGNAAKLANAGLAETLGTLGIMAQTGPPEIVATQLRAFFLRLATTDPTALRRAGGLVKYLQQLRRLGPMDLKKIFPDRRAFLGVSIMVRMLPQIARAISEVEKAGGKTAENLRTRMDTLVAQWRRMWTAIKDLALSFGDPIASVLRKHLEVWAGGLSKWRDAAQKAGEAVAGLTDKVLTFFEALTWEKVKEGFGELGGVATAAADALFAVFDEAALKIEGVFLGLWGKIGQGLKETVANAFMQVGKVVERKFQDVLLDYGWEQWGQRGMSHIPELGIEGGTFWQDLSREQQLAAVEWLREGSILHRAAIQSREAMLAPLAKAAEFAVGLAAALRESKDAAEWTADKLKELGPRIEEAGRKRVEAVAALGGAAGAAAASVLPAAPAQPRGQQVQSLLAKLRGDPAVRAAEKEATHLMGVAGLLRRHGYPEKALVMERHAELLRQRITDLLNTIVQSQERQEGVLINHAQEIKLLQMRVRRLATAGT